MAIASAMNNINRDDVTANKQDDDDHDYDVVMPGFRFHPTEEELVEFYLRRKVEGKRFNVELITFLDLYRYDPWELPGLAAIGEKEWYFYVPRDRKYRNGDRPNRVTTSGYWKATGADRMIRSENFRSIGLKKTLVFYSGKAPKGIRTSWIMNEYRLPLHETERLQKAEISLCRVYKRAGVEDHPSLPRSLPATRPPSSTRNHHEPAPTTQRFQPNYVGSSQQNDTKMTETSPSSSTDNMNSYTLLPNIPSTTPSVVENNQTMILLQSKQPNSCPSSFPSSSHAVDDLHKLVNFQRQSLLINTESTDPHHDHYNPNNKHRPGSSFQLLHFAASSAAGGGCKRRPGWLISGGVLRQIVGLEFSSGGGERLHRPFQVTDR
ncbi:NAC domain-containing protein 35 [Sesamum angolense]|uniref:NAC domain-containing protein 35 n=1 Tax=Sesamum angolense TaxID=2727404 RepID=A0AAE1X7R1_9LAMI|nr:NAC domain-containing protein 35 [Sesamum angolense]